MSQSRFDASNWQLRRQDTAATVTAGPVFAQVGYAFRGADPVLGITTNQQDVIGSLGLRLTDRWSILGSVRYDLTGHKLLQDIAQLKYADECFILTATYTETFITNAALGIQPDRTVMVRFDFKHLGDFAFKTDTLNNVFGVNQPQVPR